MALTAACTKVPSDYEVAQASEAALAAFEADIAARQASGEAFTAEIEQQLRAKYDSLREQTKVDYVRYFENNINDTTAQRIFGEAKWNLRLDIDRLQAILEKAGDAFKSTELYQKTAERVYNVQSSTPGHLFKDIVAQSPDGKEIKLSDYAGKGKYVLVDFWASWCPPCRAEMPLLVELYKKYKGKNFEIVGYSLDRNEADWKKGLTDLKMTWPQMSHCAFWESPGVSLYAVEGIPCTFLIDPQGIIIERGLRGEALAAKLAEVLK
ncbi:hypothetical protein AGMMS49982_09460 [Bacteroidia bacterium]|nr:hypothetical protein AGMMS49982_09460 [Bacteroidia bacterium]